MGHNWNDYNRNNMDIELVAELQIGANCDCLYRFFLAQRSCRNR